ncbi:hypothetical protein E4U54_006402 [Claviceps lovelessii]|nr:hypothetical protein E4U54_006402 [Claviceps lovelessii]
MDLKEVQKHEVVLGLEPPLAVRSLPGSNGCLREETWAVEAGTQAERADRAAASP